MTPLGSFYLRGPVGKKTVRTNIIMLNIEFPPVGGGAATANYNLLKSLSHSPTLKIDLITASPDRKFKVERFSETITIYRVGIKKKSLHYWTTFELLQWFCKALLLAHSLSIKNHYDLCHCWFGWPSGVIGYLLKSHFPYIVSLRGSDVPGYSTRLIYMDRFFFKFISRIVWRHSTAVVSNSQFLKKLAIQTCSNINIEVIYNGVDSHRFCPRQNGTRPGQTILFVGRLIERKGLIYLMEAFRGLSAIYPQSRLQIVGSGPLRNTLEEFCRVHKITEQVHFIGAVPNAEMCRIYQQADVLVVPSLSESLSNAALEAMACGLGIITTDTGVTEILHENGLVVPPKSIHDLEEALRQYLDKPDILKNHQRTCSSFALQMTWGRNAEDYCAVYSQALTRPLKHSAIAEIKSR